MANMIFLCGRGGATDSYSDRAFETIADRIHPDNAPTTTRIVRESDTVLCLVNPASTLSVHDQSVCLGQMMPPTETWHEPDAPVPDGSFGLLRSDDESVELVSDTTASRTLYYWQTGDLFVASTSQRAILHFADQVVPNETAMAWVISSGTLGPCHAWDRRVKRLHPDSRVQLDRSSWELTQQTTPPKFDPVERSHESHRTELASSIVALCGLHDAKPRRILTISSWQCHR